MRCFFFVSWQKTISRNMHNPFIIAVSIEHLLAKSEEIGMRKQLVVQNNQLLPLKKKPNPNRLKPVFCSPDLFRKNWFVLHKSQSDFFNNLPRLFTENTFIFIAAVRSATTSKRLGFA